jgi:hypothetical protein
MRNALRRRQIFFGYQTDEALTHGGENNASPFNEEK